jgi:hypothetical protein
MRAIRPLLGVTATAALSGCAVEMDTERPRSPIGAVERDCVIPVDVDRGAPASIELDGGSLWLFDDGAAALVAPTDDPCADGLDVWSDPIVALTDEEAQANADRTDGRALAVHPRSGFADDGVTWIYYDLVLHGPGFFDAERIATGVCTLADAPGTCVRTPDMVWPGAGRDWADAAFVAGGTAYVVGCDHAAAFLDLCALARVAPGDAADPAAYEYRGFDTWDTRDDNTATLFEATTVSLSAHAPSNRTLFTTADIWNNRVVLRSAEAPDAGRSDPVVLFDVPPPPEWFFGGGREHAGLRADDDHLVLSYHTGNEDVPGLHLVSFRLHDAGEVTAW